MSLVFEEQWGVFPAEILMLKGRFFSLPRIQIRSAVLPHALVPQAGIVITHALSVGTSGGKLDSCLHCSLVNFYVGKRVLHQHFLDLGVHFLHRSSEDRRSTRQVVRRGLCIQQSDSLGSSQNWRHIVLSRTTSFSVVFVLGGVNIDPV